MVRLIAGLGIVLELAAGAAITYGVWLIFPPAAFIVGGSIALFLAQGVGE